MRKNIAFLLVCLSLFLWCDSVFSASNSDKWRILNDFTSRQYDIIFESDLQNFSNDYADVFSMSKQLDAYTSMYIDLEKEKEEVETKRAEILETISSLEESIATIDEDISNSLRKITQINTDIVKTKKEIETNSIEIDNLRVKIEENTSILLDYLVYIYKKSNTVYSWSDFDNIKSILLNEESIWDLVNDLYFKWIIQVTGKKLIDNHRKYMASLYLNKVSAEKQESELRWLRKQWIIEQKILQDKKKFKEEILESSKWEQSKYERYLEDKLKMENELKLKTIKEQIKVNLTRDNILWKYNCEYMDVSKNTVDSRLLQVRDPRCYSINKIILSENQLFQSEIDTSKWNPLEWPVNPIQWITAYYRDRWYEETFWAQHNAVDIRVPQWTYVEAPMDWYVMYMRKPDSLDYSYMAIKHYDWYITVYWHLSEILVDEFQFVQKWEIIAKTGWEYGTFWAWYVTTWPHLHFEVFKDKEYIDPLAILDLTYIKYQKLPEKYELKYAIDFRNRNGYEYANLSSNSKILKLEWKTEIERQQYLINNYAAAWFRDWDMWINQSLDWWIDPSFVMCIWLAESGLGKSLVSAYNVWNVGNNDRGDRKDYGSAKEWISAIVWTLNNKYFKDFNNMWMLSWGGRAELGLPWCWSAPTEYCYASSMNHWHNNMKRCLTHLKWVYVQDDYNFRFN